MQMIFVEFSAFSTALFRLHLSSISETRKTFLKVDGYVAGEATEPYVTEPDDLSLYCRARNILDVLAILTIWKRKGRSSKIQYFASKRAAVKRSSTNIDISSTSAVEF